MRKIIFRLFWRTHEKKITRSIKYSDTHYQSLFVRGEPLFTLPRNGNTVEFLIDGEMTLKRIAEAMIEAKSTIYITDWRMDFDLVLVRDPSHPLHNLTLLELLKIKAREGVQIRIMLYLSPCFMDITKNQYNHVNNRIIEKNIIIEYIRWNVAYSYHQKSIIIDHSIGFIGGIDLAHGRWDNHQHSLDSSLEQNGIKVFQNDYYNSMMKCTSRKVNTNCPKVRLPWHDIHCKIVGPSVFDIERNFIELWNNKTSLGTRRETRLKYHLIPQSIGHVNIQIVRSICSRSGGNSSKRERGCYEAMLRMITKAEHYIYIEQQYFVTNYGGNTIWNIVGVIICERIIKAFKEHRKFKVILVTPIFSEGESDSLVVKSLMYLIKKSIYKGKTSIYQRLKNAGITNVEEYFIVLTLYKYEQLPESDTIIASPIYIHSKFILVDDKYIFIGSPNINDRSLMGDRDSEIGALIVDSEEITIDIDKKSCNVSRLGNTLRKQLWSEHLAINQEELNDPIQVIEDMIVPIAESNSTVFERNFLFFPSNNYRRFVNRTKHLYPLFTGDVDELNNIKGHFIPFPLYFGELEKQSLSIGNIMIE